MIAKTGNGVGSKNNFRLSAILVKKNRMREAAVNSRKTHPLLSNFYSFPFLHAESSVIIKHGISNCEGYILYVIRILKNNNLALAKPCFACQKLIQSVGIKRVYYSINNDEYNLLKY